MKRYPDWPKRLHDFVDGVKRRPFDWREHECAVAWAGGCVAALTGADVAERWRGRFTSMRGALRVMRNDGFADLGDMAASALPEIHIARARLGDVAFVPQDDGFGGTLGIVNGETILVLREDGMGLVSLFDATRAFQVG